MKAWHSKDDGNVSANGRNWNCLRLLTGLGQEKAGHRMKQINFQFKDNHILLILKKDSPKGPMVAFIECEDLDKSLWVAASLTKSKQIPWKADKWGTMRKDKT